MFGATKNPITGAHKPPDGVVVRFFRSAWRSVKLLRFFWLTINKLVMLVVVLKVMVLMNMGEDQYRARLAAITAPARGDQLGQAAMGLDPLTLKLRDIIMQFRALEARKRIPTHLTVSQDPKP